MPDAIFEHPRLARLYDSFDGERDDLLPYVRIIRELGANHILDVGCGTGTFACLVAGDGYQVTAVEPAQASLAIAQTKPNASRVLWVYGDATDLPRLTADVATMTANVAQVFVDDADWLAALTAIYRALRSGGHLVFEVRNPAARAWEGWTREHTEQSRTISGEGVVRTFTEVLDVMLPFVSFAHTYHFADGSILTSTSTLRFRTQQEIEASLTNAGFTTAEVREAPDRPGKELVFIAKRRG